MQSKKQKTIGELRRLLREDEAADYLGVVKKTLQAWRAQGKGPRYVRMNGRAIRYPEDALIEYQESLRVYRSTAEYAG
ncbi:MAG: helix-turn-helix transcriptional regulator [Methylosarcina sp.]